MVDQKNDLSKFTTLQKDFKVIYITFKVISIFFIPFNPLLFVKRIKFLTCCGQSKISLGR